MFIGITHPKFKSSPLKDGGWKITFLLGFGLFSGGGLLNFGGVNIYFLIISSLEPG